MRAFSSFSATLDDALSTLENQLRSSGASAHYFQQFREIEAVRAKTNGFRNMMRDMSASLKRFQSDASSVSVPQEMRLPHLSSTLPVISADDVQSPKCVPVDEDDDKEEPPFIVSRTPTLDVPVPDVPDESDTMSVAAEISRYDLFSLSRRQLWMGQHEDDDAELMEGRHTSADADGESDFEEPSPIQLAGEVFNGEFHFQDTPGDDECGSVADQEYDLRQPDLCQHNHCPSEAHSESVSLIHTAADPLIEDLKHKARPGDFDLIKFKNDSIARQTSSWAQQPRQMPFQAMDTPKGAANLARIQHRRFQSGPPNLKRVRNRCTVSKTGHDKQGIRRLSSERGESTMPHMKQTMPTLLVNDAPPKPLRPRCCPQLLPTTINCMDGDASFCASAAPPTSMSEATKAAYIFNENDES